MADKKISALPAATTPLAGTEVLPIVQGGTTDQVSVANLTAGRAVSVASLTTTGNVGVNITPSAWNTNFRAVEIGAFGTSIAADTNNVFTEILNNAYASGISTYTYNSSLGASRYSQQRGDHVWYTAPSGTAGAAVSFTQAMTLSQAGNLTANVGNFVVGTAGRGIDFSANTHAAGMTSELLNDYEEGTWTPNQGPGLTVVGAFSSSGTYTKVGRCVTVIGSVAGATSVAVGSGGIIVSNLPYTVSGTGEGAAGTGNVNQGTVVLAFNVQVYAMTAITAAANIDFTVTYFV